MVRLRGSSTSRLPRAGFVRSTTRSYGARRSLGGGAGLWRSSVRDGGLGHGCGHHFTSVSRAGLTKFEVWLCAGKRLRGNISVDSSRTIVFRFIKWWSKRGTLSGVLRVATPYELGNIMLPHTSGSKGPVRSTLVATFRHLGYTEGCGCIPASGSEQGRVTLGGCCALDGREI